MSNVKCSVTTKMGEQVFGYHNYVLFSEEQNEVIMITAYPSIKDNVISINRKHVGIVSNCNTNISDCILT